MLRQRVHNLDPAGGSPGQVAQINEAGTAVEWGDVAEADIPGGALATWLVPLVTTNTSGDFDFVWSEDGELIYMEVPQ